MLGAIIGDIIGSRFEWYNIKTKEFEFFHKDCRPTDDTIMTLAVAKALMNCNCDIEKLPQAAVSSMLSLGRAYPHAGYGGYFKEWLKKDNPEPYNSYGNGAAMRVSPCGWMTNSIAEVRELSRAVTAVSHNHPQGIKGAEAVAVAIVMARNGHHKGEISLYIHQHYYPLDFILDEIRGNYTFDVRCQGSVPQAIQAFFESIDFEDAIRNAISIGGDSDTIAAITGSIAEAYYGIPPYIRSTALSYLDSDQKDILHEFEFKINHINS